MEMEIIAALALALVAALALALVAGMALAHHQAQVTQLRQEVRLLADLVAALRQDKVRAARAGQVMAETTQADNAGPKI